MAKEMVIEIPDWVDEKKLRKVLAQAISQATREISVREIRKMLNIKPKDLKEEIETIDVNKLRRKEKKRIEW